MPLFIHEDGILLAFFHPQPPCPLQILIDPKLEIQGLDSIQAVDRDYLRNLYESAQRSSAN